MASGANYCIVNVPTAGTVILTGYKYNDNTKIVIKKMTDLPAGEKENVIEIKDAYLISSQNSVAIAEHVFNYYQNRIQQNTDLILEDELVGNIVETEVMNNEFRKAAIESIETDLTGGFISSIRSVGV